MTKARTSAKIEATTMARILSARMARASPLTLSGNVSGAQPIYSRMMSV